MLAITLYLDSNIVNDKYGQKNFNIDIDIGIYYTCTCSVLVSNLKTGFADLCNEINPTD